jgi:hypothetical protein
MARDVDARFSAARLASYAVAGLVHLGTLVVVALAVTLGINAVHHLWGFVFVALLLGLAWLMRPRLGTLPADGLVKPEEAPALYGLCDDVARAYGRRAPNYVVVDGRFGAAAGAVGLRRRRVVTLGLPLVATLSPQARVALVALHLAPEETHGPQSLFVRSAIGALDEWCRLLAPQERQSIWGQTTVTGSTGDGLYSAGFYSIGYGARFGGSKDIESDRFLGAIMWIVARPSVWLLRLETRLVARDWESAAYRAERQAAEVAGTSAMVDLYEHLRLRARILGIVQQEARAGRDGLLSRVTAAVDAIPSDGSGGEGGGDELLAPGQPPAGGHVQLLEQQAPATAKVVLDSGRSTAIDHELESRASAVEDELYDWYRSSIYR